MVYAMGSAPSSGSGSALGIIDSLISLSALGRIRADGRAVEVRSVPGLAGRTSTSPLECYVDDALVEELVSRFRLE